MMERHVYKIEDGDRHQLYVFHIDRQGARIVLKSIWLLIIHNGLETKIILNIPGIMDQMAIDTETKSTPKTDKLLDEIFSEMIMAQQEAVDLVTTHIEEDSTDILLDAAHKAEIIHNETFDDILARINENKSTKH